jgi:hypothetical protein
LAQLCLPPVRSEAAPHPWGGAGWSLTSFGAGGASGGALGVCWISFMTAPMRTSPMSTLGAPAPSVGTEGGGGGGGSGGGRGALSAPRLRLAPAAGGGGESFRTSPSKISSTSPIRSPSDGAMRPGKTMEPLGGAVGGPTTALSAASAVRSALTIAASRSSSSLTRLVSAASSISMRRRQASLRPNELLPVACGCAPAFPGKCRCAALLAFCPPPTSQALLDGSRGRSRNTSHSAAP